MAVAVQFFVKKMFHSTYLKLTAFYVLVVMIISIVFSMVLYQISSAEINRGLNRQSSIIQNMPVGGRLLFPLDEIENARQQQIDESNGHLETNLVYFNILILILSSAGAYFFARKTLKPIEEMVDAQNRFTADASHELKTPLTAMRSEIEVNLRDEKLTGLDAKKLLTSNLEEIGKLESLSNALLKLAKYDSDHKHDFKEVALSEIITEAYERVIKLAEKKSIVINCHPELDSGSLKTKVLGDKPSLVELFVILLDNAIKYSPEKTKVSIDISEDKKQAQIKIIDQGIGIKATDLPHIFNRFYRADQSRCKEKCDGYGLGLSIAKRIVDLHSGEISATSTPDHGSEFTVKLPSS